jgi:hypothetical protein
MPRTVDSKSKVSNTLRRLVADGILNPGQYLPEVLPFTRLYGAYQCHACSSTFWQLTRDQKCCSIECRDNIRSQNKCRKTHIEYFSKFDNINVDLQSTWELTVAKWLDANSIAWSRPTKRVKWFCQTAQKTRTYLPDFYIVDHSYFIDVKNPIKVEQDKIKLATLKSIIPLFVGNIEETIEFVARLAGLEPTCIH